MSDSNATTTVSRQGLVLAEDFAAVRRWVSAAKARGLRVGFVPTMGSLHAGHLSLMHAARRECDFVVASIFVNPTQFGPNEDFRQYPRTLERDLRHCEEAGMDLVFHPTTEQVYPAASGAPFATFVEVAGLSDVLEGKFRPGHFRGVATVVLKLFNIVEPHVAYFGQKDYQQQTIIRRMCVELNLPVEIRICPTVREPDGLALSSRNVYLQGEERQSALALSRSLQLVRQLVEAGETDARLLREKMYAPLAETPLVKPDYATLADPDTLHELTAVQARMVALVAARVGRTRLIDNLVIER